MTKILTGTAMWNGVKQIAKKLPGFRGLVAQRDLLSKEVTTLRARVMELEHAVSYWQIKQAEGQLLELDYPVTPLCRSWEQSPAIMAFIQRLAKDQPQYTILLQEMASMHELIWSIPAEAEENDPTPRWLNGWLPGLDAISLMHFTLSRRPQNIWEIGSGNSSKFFRKAIKHGQLSTRLVCIDPHPRVKIADLADLLIQEPLESVEISRFSEVQSGDIIFVDNSHRALQNSDVTVFFSELLPMLPSNVLVGIHDIFLPHDYPQEWLGRYYNEQYLLLAYLHNNEQDQIIFPNAFISEQPELMAHLAEIFMHPSMRNVERHGDIFWVSTG